MGPMMDFRELQENYQALLVENTLKKENAFLKARLGIPEPSLVDNRLDPHEKIRLFMRLFKGRVDVYAQRWENRAGRSGYTPLCLHEWISAGCRNQR